MILVGVCLWALVANHAPHAGGFVLIMCHASVQGLAACMLRWGARVGRPPSAMAT